MEIINQTGLEKFVRKHKELEQFIMAWICDVTNGEWQSLNSLEREFSNVRIVPPNRAVFNIRGNSYRLVIAIDFERKCIDIRFVGTHAEYDNIDVRRV